MHIAIEIILSVLLVVGATFALIGSFGLSKLADFYMRLHGPTKASTLGLGAMLLASTIFFAASEGQFGIHEVLITIFLFITAPVSAHMLAKTALYKNFEYVGGQPDPLDHPLNVHTDQLIDLTGKEEAEFLYDDDDDFDPSYDDFPDDE